MPCRNRSVTTIIALVFATLFSAANAGEIMSPWKIQETLASKTYVDLTHEFQPGIPRWSGFPDETRKTIYWYEKRPDTLDADFSPSCSRISVNGGRTSIRLLISSKGCARRSDRSKTVRLPRHGTKRRIPILESPRRRTITHSKLTF